MAMRILFMWSTTNLVSEAVNPPRLSGHETRSNSYYIALQMTFGA
jgi:hypothetical protein